MEETWFKKNYKRILIVAIEVILILAVFLIRYHYVTTPGRTVLCACDAFFSIGMIYLVWGAILYAISKGAGDGIAYYFHLRRGRFSRKVQLDESSRYDNFYDFTKNRERRPNNARLFAFCGGIAFLISLVLLIFCY